MILQVLITTIAGWINRHQQQVIAYLLEENRTLHAKLGGKRIRFADAQRRRLAALAFPLGRKRLTSLATLATPDTLMRWYKQLVAQKCDGSQKRNKLGRPRVAEEIEQLTVRMASENPRWGYRRMQGALSNVGYHIDKSTVRNILRRNHIDPAPIRESAGMSWSQFMKLHWEVLMASGFFEARLSTLAHFWTGVIQLARNFSTRSMLRLGLIRHSAMSVLALLAQQNPDVRSRWLLNFGIRCGLDVGRHQHVSHRLAPAVYCASSQPKVLQHHLRQVEQERSPPLYAMPIGRRLANPNHFMGSRTSNSHRIVVSPMEGSHNPASDHSPSKASSADSYARAA